MKKILIILLLTSAFIPILFFGCKIFKNISATQKEVALVKKTAISYVYNKYPGFDFYISAMKEIDDYYIVNYYIVKLKVADEKYSTVSLTYNVYPRYNLVDENGLFPISEASLWNEYVLTGEDPTATTEDD